MTRTRKQWAETIQDTDQNQPDVCVLMDLSCWIHQSPSITVCRTFVLPTGDIFSIVPV